LHRAVRPVAGGLHVYDALDDLVVDCVAEWWFLFTPGVYRNSGLGSARCGGWVRPPVIGRSSHNTLAPPTQTVCHGNPPQLTTILIHYPIVVPLVTARTCFIYVAATRSDLYFTWRVLQGGPWPSQNVDWVGKCAFGAPNIWPVCSLVVAL